MAQCRQEQSKLLSIFFSASLGSSAATGFCRVQGAGWVCAVYFQLLLVSHQLPSTCLLEASFWMGNVSLNLNVLNFFFLLSRRSLASCEISFEMKVETENDGAQKDQITRQLNSEDPRTPKQYKGHPEIKIPSSALRVTSPPHQRGFMFIFCTGKGNWRCWVLRRGQLLLSPS